MSTLTDRSIVVVSILAFCGCAAVMAAQISAPDVPAPASDKPAADGYPPAELDKVSAVTHSVVDIFSKP